MRRWGLTALMVLTAAAPGEAGWVIDQVSRTAGGAETTQQVLVQANRMKTAVLVDGKPASAVVLDVEGRTLTQIDYQGRHYFTSTVEEFRQALAGAQQTAGERMEEALRSLPPERRRMIEEMMRRQGVQAGSPAPAAPCPEPRALEVRPTAERETIAGYPARRYDVLADGEPRSQVWVAAGIAAWRELDRDKLQAFAEELSRFAACQPGRVPGGVLGGDDAWKLMGEGYPARVVRARGGSTEVVKAQERALAAAEFEPPAGFARRSLGDLGSRRR